MNPAQEPVALRQMRAWVTATFIVVLGVYAGVSLVVVSSTWWQPVLLVPSMLAALWVTARWHVSVRPRLTVGILTLGWVTWASAAWLAIGPAGAFGLALAGAVTISKLGSHRGRYAAVLIALVFVTGLLSLFQGLEQASGHLVVAPLVTALIITLFWLNQIAWQLFTELDATRRSETELALVKERFRFATDLHDIQGHTLHVVKLKTALAERLVRVDPDTAEDELRQVRALIAETLGQTKSLAYGQCKTTLDGELENAKNLFEAAGIEVHATRDGSPDSRVDEHASLVLREATTNILRHAHATKVGIVLGSTGITITNDGAGNGTDLTLRGLADLRQRVAEAGGTLEITRDSGTFLTAAVFDHNRTR